MKVTYTTRHGVSNTGSLGLRQTSFRVGADGVAGPPGPISAITAAETILLDGGGSPLTTGIKADLLIPYACTITEWTILADQVGSIVVDIWNDTYENYPPTIADTITAAAKPTISNDTKGQSSTLTGWNPTISAGSILRFNIDSVSTINRASIILTLTRT